MDNEHSPQLWRHRCHFLGFLDILLQFPNQLPRGVTDICEAPCTMQVCCLSPETHVLEMIFPFALKLPCVTWFRAVLPPLLLKVPAVSSSGPGEDPCTLPLQVLLRGQGPPPWSCGCSWGVEAKAIMGAGIHQRRKIGSLIWSLQLRNKPAAFPERPAPLQKLEEERLGCWDLAAFGSACPTVPQPWLVASRLCGTLSQPLRQQTQSETAHFLSPGSCSPCFALQILLETAQ